MRVLMTSDAVGGVWTYTAELAGEYDSRGVEIAVATMGPRPSAVHRAQISTLRHARIFESEYKLEWMDDPWLDVERAGDWLLDIEKEFRPDIIHLNGYTHAVLRWSAPKLIVAHSCVLSWWLAVKGEPAPESNWRTYREKVRAGLQAADRVIAPTRAMLYSIRELYGPVPNAHVIPNGRDPSQFHACNPKEPIIVSAGRLWDEAKNTAALDRICGELAWPVFLAGNVAEPSGKTKLTPANVCRSLGQLNPQQFADVLARAAIFCLPARYEPFGLSVLEAALSGCALVIGDIPSLRETWDGAAAFVSPADDGQLAATVSELIADPEKRIGLAGRAELRASALTAAQMAERYLQIYASVLNTPSSLHIPSSPQAKVNACAS